MFRDQPLHGVAVYNPDLLSKDELIRLFVARQPLLDRLLGDIRREGSGAVQHHLLIGRRGMGKTTLLRRLAHAIDDDPALAAIWLPLTFPEEQYNVGHLSDFWLNCLDALGDRLERRGQTEHLGDLDDDIARITELTPEKARQEAALAHLEAMARRLDRRFVLLVDNVDLILDRVKADEWALRAALSTAPWLLLIGATSVGVESTYQYEAAFYDFFRVHALKGLDEPETFGLLRRLAETFDAPHVARLLDAEPGRIRTLRLLAGGNPRTLVLLFSLLSQGIEGNVRTDLERLLDHCTPLYKARFEAMAAQQQQVVDAMAVHWHPITAGDLATRLRMDVNAVSSQLNRLVRDGVVEKVAIHESRRAGFQVAERFFNIWYLMRASRRVRKHLVWLVEFLRLMYAPNTLAAMAAKHLDDQPGDDSEGKLHHAEYALALANVVQDTGLRYSLESQGLRLLAWDPRLRRQLSEMLDLDGDDAPLKNRAERMRLLAEAEETCLNATQFPEGYDGASLWQLVSEQLLFDAQSKHTLLTSLTNPSHLTNPNLLNGATEALRTLETLRLAEERSLGGLVAELRRGVQIGELESIFDHTGLVSDGRGTPKTVFDIVASSTLADGRTSGVAALLAIAMAHERWDLFWSTIERFGLQFYPDIVSAPAEPPLLGVSKALHSVVLNEKAPAALAALDRTDLADRWRPLREALAAIVAGTRAVLTRVAPEIREPALVLIDQLKPDLPG